MVAGIDRVVVVGGGIGGVSTVAALRAGGYDGELTLVEAGGVPYDRPPLSKDYLAGVKDLGQIGLQPPKWYDDNGIRLRLHTVVAALRPAEGGVELADGSVLAADRVVLATGGAAARPPIPGADTDRVHVLRSAADADTLRERLLPGARVLVVGGGLIGAEVASTASDLGCEVVLVDPVSPPLAGAVGPEIAAWLHGLHAERGVTTVRAGVETLSAEGSELVAQIAGEAGPRRFDVAVLGVGMVPVTGLADAAGLEVARGIVVDDGQVTSNPSVLAVGDPVRIRRRDGVLEPRTEHWEAAQHDGKRAAATILGTAGPPPSAPWFWTDRYGRHVEAVGQMATGERTILRGRMGADSFSAFAIRADHVVGAVAVDDSHAVRAARRMIDHAVRIDPAQLADPAVDLRKLLRG